MIDLTPLDVRNKRGDFKRLMRGYDPQEVDVFLELVAERLEALVRENIQLKERTQTLQQQVTSQLGREQAVQDALVTAQELRADIKAQSQREADTLIKEAETEARRVVAEAEGQARAKLRGVERQIDGVEDMLGELQRRRARFLKDFRALLERELDVVGVEDKRTPLEERTIDLDIGTPRPSAREAPRTRVPERIDAGEREVARSDDPDADAPGGGAERTPSGPPPATGLDAEPDAPAEPAPPAGTGEAEDDARPAGTDTRAAGGDEGPAARGARLGDATGVATDVTASDEAGDADTESDADTEGDEAIGSAYDDLAASMEAEAMAEAQSQVVEVTGADVDEVRDVPRLEEVLAEAGAELVEAPPEHTQGPLGRPADKIEPPRIDESSDSAFLFYPDKDDDR